MSPFTRLRSATAFSRPDWVFATSALTVVTSVFTLPTSEETALIFESAVLVASSGRRFATLLVAAAHPAAWLIPGVLQRFRLRSFQSTGRRGARAFHGRADFIVKP
jgi:hypothetical protein